MNHQRLRIVLVLLWTIAVLGTGCMPYHRGGVGIEVDIHSQAYRDQHYGHRDKYDRWDADGNWDENGHWDRKGRWHKGHRHD